jgi:hypothetical protein
MQTITTTGGKLIITKILNKKFSFNLDLLSESSSIPNDRFMQYSQQESSHFPSEITAIVDSKYCFIYKKEFNFTFCF